MLRFAILSFRTHQDTIDTALLVLQEKAAALEQELALQNNLYPKTLQ